MFRKHFLELPWDFFFYKTQETQLAIAKLDKGGYIEQQLLHFQWSKAEIAYRMVNFVNLI